MSEELTVHLAYDMAMAGREVALISSGDICVMAWRARTRSID